MIQSALICQLENIKSDPVDKRDGHGGAKALSEVAQADWGCGEKAHGEQGAKWSPR